MGFGVMEVGHLGFWQTGKEGLVLVFPVTMPVQGKVPGDEKLSCIPTEESCHGGPKLSKGHFGRECAEEGLKYKMGKFDTG